MKTGLRALRFHDPYKKRLNWSACRPDMRMALPVSVGTCFDRFSTMSAEQPDVFTYALLHNCKQLSTHVSVCVLTTAMLKDQQLVLEIYYEGLLHTQALETSRAIQSIASVQSRCFQHDQCVHNICKFIHKFPMQLQVAEAAFFGGSFRIRTFPDICCSLGQAYGARP